MKNIFYCLFSVLALATFCLSEPGKGSPSTNKKNRGALEAYNQDLRGQGWHRKEANALTDALAHTFGGAELLPLPIPSEYVTKMFKGYQADYVQFERNFPNATQSFPRQPRRRRNFFHQQWRPKLAIDHRHHSIAPA